MSSIEKLFTPNRFQSLISGSEERISFLQATEGTLIEKQPPHEIALFPGSFNPLHIGHQEMAHVAAKRLECPVWFEMSISNVDKATLNYGDVVQRLKQFEKERYLATAQGLGHATTPLCPGVVLTSAPTFEEKSKLFPDCVFIVGADTITRINDLRFYRDANHRADVIQSFAEGFATRQPKRFLVFGRWREDVFELDQVELAPELRAQCDFVSRQEFEQRISSTELRD